MREIGDRFAWNGGAGQGFAEPFLERDRSARSQMPVRLIVVGRHAQGGVAEGSSVRTSAEACAKNITQKRSALC